MVCLLESRKEGAQDRRDLLQVHNQSLALERANTPSATHIQGPSHFSIEYLTRLPVVHIDNVCASAMLPAKLDVNTTFDGTKELWVCKVRYDEGIVDRRSVLKAKDVAVRVCEERHECGEGIA